MTILKNNKRKKIKTEVQEKSYFIKSIKIYTIWTDTKLVNVVHAAKCREIVQYTQDHRLLKDHRIPISRDIELEGTNKSFPFTLVIFFMINFIFLMK